MWTAHAQSRSPLSATEVGSEPTCNLKQPRGGTGGTAATILSREPTLGTKGVAAAAAQNDAMARVGANQRSRA
jgi:hypothetical protein